MADTRPPRPLDALRERDYRWFWIGAFISNTGGWMQNATIPYVVFQLTGSAGEVGLTGFFQYLPFMVMGIAGGALADRFPRRRLLIWAQVAQAGAAFALWAVVASGTATVAMVAGLAFVAGLLGGVNTPIWQAFVVELVPRELLLGAVTLNSTQFNASRALGPFLAGIVIAVWGAQAAFLLNAVSFGAVVFVLLLIRAGSDGTRRTVEGGVLAGLGRAARYTRATPAIFACCLAIMAVAGLGSPLFSYLPVYGEEIFGVTGVQLGLLFGAGGIGSVIAAPVLLSVAPRMPRARLLAGAMATYGAAVVAVGLLPGYWAVLGALLFFGGRVPVHRVDHQHHHPAGGPGGPPGHGDRPLPDVPDGGAAAGPVPVGAGGGRHRPAAHHRGGRCPVGGGDRGVLGDRSVPGHGCGR